MKQLYVYISKFTWDFEKNLFFDDTEMEIDYGNCLMLVKISIDLSIGTVW